MDHQAFATLVEQGTGAGRERAERAIHATLQTLAERIAPGEARDLAAQLPPEVAPWLATISDPEAFDRDEFLRRVAEREGVDPATAERDARAVFVALGQAVTPEELDDLAAELSKDFDPLLPRGPGVDVMPAATFVQRVAERAGSDPDAAQRAAEAVLETLAERIAGGEVEDLIARLPLELHPPLRRGVTHSGGRPKRLSLDEFLARVAQREGTDVLTAREHARAVFATLREAVGDGEFFDVTDQLPNEYRAIEARAGG